MAVEDICRDLGLADARVSLGRMTLDHELVPETRKELYERLRLIGFEPLESDDHVAVERIMALVRNYVRNMDARQLKLSSYIADNMCVVFKTASRLFTAVEGRPIQRYLMLQRIEYVKELLHDHRLSLAQIADIAGFSSVPHLSATFKREVGVTLSEFRQQGERRGIDEL